MNGIDDYIVRGGTAGFTDITTGKFYTFDEMLRRGYSIQELLEMPLGFLPRSAFRRRSPPPAQFAAPP
jgi:hypothetical protein